MKKIILLTVALVFASAAFAEDFEYNSGGSIDIVPTTGGSNDGWGEWFITSVLNDTGYDLMLTEFGFPCCGPATGPYGWVVWTDVGGLVAPSGPASSADYYGEFTPDDPDPGTFPPTDYTYIDVSASSVIIPDGNYFCFGYDNTGTGGQVSYNGVETWAWYGGVWDPDPAWSRTAVLQVMGDFEGALDQTTWGSIKNAF